MRNRLRKTGAPTTTVTSIPLVDPHALPANASIGELVRDATTQISTLVRAEVELAKAEITRDVKKGLTGSVFFIIAGVVLLYSTFFMFFFLAELLDTWMWRWAAFLTVFLLMLLVTALFAFLGYRKVRRIRGPQQAIESVKETTAALTPSLAKFGATSSAPTAPELTAQAAKPAPPLPRAAAPVSAPRPPATPRPAPPRPAAPPAPVFEEHIPEPITEHVEERVAVYERAVGEIDTDTVIYETHNVDDHTVVHETHNVDDHTVIYETHNVDDHAVIYETHNVDDHAVIYETHNVDDHAIVYETHGTDTEDVMYETAAAEQVADESLVYETTVYETATRADVVVYHEQSPEEDPTAAVLADPDAPATLNPDHLPRDPSGS